MRWGPARGIALGGLGFGILVLVIGTIFLLVNQKVIAIEVFDIWTVCSIGLILIGVLVIGGTLWARRMMRRGWRDWVPDWRKD